MATVKAYVVAMRTAQKQVGLKLGSGLGDKRAQVLVTSVLAILGVLIKLLVDKGIVTDAELQAALNAAQADTYADEPDDPVQ
jgi:hypothetical protein